MLVVWARAAFLPGYPELILNTGLNRAIKDLGALVEGSKGAQSCATTQKCWARG